MWSLWWRVPALSSSMRTGTVQQARNGRATDIASRRLIRPGCRLSRFVKPYIYCLAPREARMEFLYRPRFLGHWAESIHTATPCARSCCRTAVCEPSTFLSRAVGSLQPLTSGVRATDDPATQVRNGPLRRPGPLDYTHQIPRAQEAAGGVWAAFEMGGGGEPNLSPKWGPRPTGKLRAARRANTRTRRLRRQKRR